MCSLKCLDNDFVVVETVIELYLGRQEDHNSAPTELPVSVARLRFSNAMTLRDYLVCRKWRIFCVQGGMLANSSDICNI